MFMLELPAHVWCAIVYKVSELSVLCLAVNIAVMRRIVLHKFDF